MALLPDLFLIYSRPNLKVPNQPDKFNWTGSSATALGRPIFTAARYLTAALKVYHPSILLSRSGFSSHHFLREAGVKLLLSQFGRRNFVGYAQSGAGREHPAPCRLERGKSRKTERDFHIVVDGFDAASHKISFVPEAGPARILQKVAPPEAVRFTPAPLF